MAFSMGPPPDMAGKAVLVTGVSGEIGRAVAVRLAALGAAVCAVDEDPAAVAIAAEAVRGAGGQALAHAADVASSDACRAAVDAAVAAFGRLDAVCNLANAFFPAKAAEMDPAQFERTLMLNVAAPFYLFQAAIPHLLEAEGAVVTVSSAAGTLAVPNTAAYSASKAGVNHLTRVLAKEYAESPVRINAVAAGAIAVDLTPKDDAAVDPRSVQRKLVSRGTISPAELAEVIVFLASDAGRAFNGAIIAMDKGMSLG